MTGPKTIPLSPSGIPVKLNGGANDGFSNWCVVDPASPGPGLRGSFSNKFKTLAGALAAAQPGDVVAITSGTHVGSFDLSAFDDLTIMGLGSEGNIIIANVMGAGLPTIKIAPVGGAPRRIRINGLQIQTRDAAPALAVDGSVAPIDTVDVGAEIMGNGPGSVAVDIRFARSVNVGGVQNGNIQSRNSSLSLESGAEDILFIVDPGLGPGVVGQTLSLNRSSARKVTLSGAPNVVGDEGSTVAFFDGKTIQSFAAPPMTLQMSYRGKTLVMSNLAVPDAGYTPALAAIAPMTLDFDEATFQTGIRFAPVGAVAGRERIKPTARNALFTNLAVTGSISVGDKVDLDIRGAFYQQVHLAVDGFPGMMTADHGSINRDWYSPTNWLPIILASGVPNQYDFIPYPDANQYGVLVTPRTIVAGDEWAILAKTDTSVTIQHDNPAAAPQTFDLEFTSRRWAP